MFYNALPMLIESFKYEDFIFTYERWKTEVRIKICNVYRQDHSWAEIWNYGDVLEVNLSRLKSETIPAHLISTAKLWLNSSYNLNMSLEEFLNITFKNMPQEAV